MKGLAEIKDDLSFLKDYEVVVFGSYEAKIADKRSDIDIAVITRENDRNRGMEIWSELLGKTQGVYDIKLFGTSMNLGH